MSLINPTVYPRNINVPVIAGATRFLLSGEDRPLAGGRMLLLFPCYRRFVYDSRHLFQPGDGDSAVVDRSSFSITEAGAPMRMLISGS